MKSKILYPFLAAIMVSGISFLLFFLFQENILNFKARVFFFILLYGISPIVYGIFLKVFIPSWGRMLLSLLGAAIIFGLVSAAVFTVNPEGTYLGNSFVESFVFSLLVPAVVISYALTGAVRKKQRGRQRRLTVIASCLVGIVYIGAVGILIGLTAFLEYGAEIC